MTDTNTEIETEASSEAEATPASHGPSLQLAGRDRPLVLRVKGRKGKKKRRYSRSLRGMQVGMRRLDVVGDRLGDAVASGLRAYRKKADRSSRKRKDGALQDVLENSAASLGVVLRKSSKVPVLLARTVSRRSRRRNIRTLGRILNAFRTR